MLAAGVGRRSFFCVSLSALVLLGACARDHATVEAGAASAGPALWRVADEDTTVYLFGTIHALPDEVVWFDGKIRAAWASADQVALEAVDQDDLPQLQRLTMQYGIDPDGRPLGAALSRETAARLDETLSQIGLPRAVIEPMEPWMAVTTLVSAQIVSMGYDPRQGVDIVLRARAQEAGKALVGLENTEGQFALLDALPRGTQIRWLETVLAEWEQAPETLDALARAWHEGDVEELAEEIRDSMHELPGLIDAMLTRRNRAFAEWIVARMEAPGTVFFAVGAAHLAGEDSVQAFLHEHGLSAERL